jgi:hypothetical protein
MPDTADPKAETSAGAMKAEKKHQHHPRDPAREVVESSP